MIYTDQNVALYYSSIFLLQGTIGQKGVMQTADISAGQILNMFSGQVFEFTFAVVKECH